MAARGTNMGVHTKILQRMKSWRLWAGVIVVAGALAGGYYAFTVLTDSSDGEDDDTQTQLVPVTRGDLVNDVSMTGTLQYVTRETLTFAQQGFVADLTVREGDQVSAGDALAMLDAETIANLEKAVAQARVNVRNAEDALEDAQTPYSDEQIAKAESDVAKAQVALEDAQKELDEFGDVSDDALAQARIDILNAQSQLDKAEEDRDALTTPTLKDVAKAESDVTAARVALEDAQDDLDELTDPLQSAIAAAQAKVAIAQLDLQTARDDLDKLQISNTVALAEARKAVADAELAIETAQKEIEDADETSPSTTKRIADLRANIDTANENLTKAQSDLGISERDAADKIKTAEDDLTKAKDEYSDVFIKWIGLELTAQQLGSDPDTIFESLGADLAYIFDGPHIDRMRSQFEIGVLQDDPETAWDDIVVFSWSTFLPVGAVVDCRDPDVESGLGRSCIRNEFKNAWDAVENQTTNLETVTVQQDGKVQDARSAISTARNTLDERQDDLDDFLAGLSESNLKSKIEKLELAKVNLTSAQEDLANLSSEPDPLDVASKQRAVETAEATLADATEELDTLMEPGDLSIESKQMAVQTAEANLADAEKALADLTEATEAESALADREVELAQAKIATAEKALADLLADPNPSEQRVKETTVRLAEETLAEAEKTLAEYNTVDQLDIALRQRDLVTVRAALDTSIADLERATLRAPFDGVVADVNIELGQQVNAGTDAIEIIDPSAVEVSGSVDEIDVLFLQVGAQAFITLEALGDQLLEGVVSSIANSGTSAQGIVTYPVKIRVNSTESARLPEGLSATAQVIIREQTDAILIPLQALYGTSQAPTVRVSNGNDTIERPVTIGISDDFWVVVEDGLEEGETIIMEVVGSGDPFGFGGFGPFGGPGRPRGDR